MQVSAEVEQAVTAAATLGEFLLEVGPEARAAAMSELAAWLAAWQPLQPQSAIAVPASEQQLRYRPQLVV